MGEPRYTPWDVETVDHLIEAVQLIATNTSYVGNNLSPRELARLRLVERSAIALVADAVENDYLFTTVAGLVVSLGFERATEVRDCHNALVKTGK